MSQRFFGDAAVVVLTDGAFGVALDGRPVRTPGGAALTMPSEALAKAIATEWAAQDGKIRPLSMPMMRLAATAIDRIGRERDAVVEQLVAYGGSDLLCYRAEGPEALVRRQDAIWQPLLDWAAEAFGATLAVTEGVTHVSQPSEALAGLRQAVEAMDDLEVAALSQLTAGTGSLVVALAVWVGRIGADEAVAASQLDEHWQAERWGKDAEAQARLEIRAHDIADAARFLELLKEGPADPGE